MILVNFNDKIMYNGIIDETLNKRVMNILSKKTSIFTEI